MLQFPMHKVLMLLLENCPLTGLLLTATYINAKACVTPAYQYFEERFDGDLEIAVSAFRCARYFDPAKICEL